MNVPDRTAEVRELANSFHSQQAGKFAGNDDGFEEFLVAFRLTLQRRLNDARVDLELSGEKSVTEALRSDFKARHDARGKPKRGINFEM
jgi:hypothetical protein